jgi:hypothetical protein
MLTKIVVPLNVRPVSLAGRAHSLTSREAASIPVPRHFESGRHGSTDSLICRTS